MTTHPDKMRCGGRNFLRVGDLAKCDPPGKGRSFIGRVMRFDADDDGTVTSVNVAVVCTVGGKKHLDAGKARAFTPDRVTRTRVVPIVEQEEEAS